MIFGLLDDNHWWGYHLRYWKMFVKEFFGLTRIARVDTCCACGNSFCGSALLFEHLRKRHGLSNDGSNMKRTPAQEWALYYGNACNPNKKYLVIE